MRIIVELNGTRSPAPGVLAYATLIIEGTFVVHGIRLLKLDKGKVIVAMPNTPHTHPCPACQLKNDVRANFCNNCAAKQATQEIGPKRLDIFHPINEAARRMIDRAVIEEYQRQTGYQL